MTMERLEYKESHYLPCQKPLKRDDWMWSILHCGKKVWSQTNYILITDQHMFQNVDVQNPRHNTDHYLVIG